MTANQVDVDTALEFQWNQGRFGSLSGQHVDFKEIFGSKKKQLEKSFLGGIF